MPSNRDIAIEAALERIERTTLTTTTRSILDDLYSIAYDNGWDAGWEERDA